MAATDAVSSIAAFRCAHFLKLDELLEALAVGSNQAGNMSDMFDP